GHAVLVAGRLVRAQVAGCLPLDDAQLAPGAALLVLGASLRTGVRAGDTGDLGAGLLGAGVGRDEARHADAHAECGRTLDELATVDLPVAEGRRETSKWSVLVLLHDPLPFRSYGQRPWLQSRIMVARNDWQGERADPAVVAGPVHIRPVPR